MPGATAAFSTRIGGVSKGAFYSLNLGIRTQDERQRVRWNRDWLASCIGLDARKVLIGNQVHGGEIAWHEEPQYPSPYADGLPSLDRVDGQATANRDLVPAIQAADCLPIALSGTRGVAMVHGGWRGLAAGIVESGVEATEATSAAIGPGIGPCCYEVGDEVLGAFPELAGLSGKQMLDLPALARGRLEAAGVKDIQSSDLCTSCDPELFFSHRRDDGHTGRQAGLVWMN
jgi:YfiH family protein